MNNDTGDQTKHLQKIDKPSNILILDKAVTLLSSYMINFRCLEAEKNIPWELQNVLKLLLTVNSRNQPIAIEPPLKQYSKGDYVQLLIRC